MINNCSQFIGDGYHPSHLLNGFERIQTVLLKYLHSAKQLQTVDSQFLNIMCQNMLNTKLPSELSAKVSSICSQAVDYVRDDNHFDSTMVEIIKFQSGSPSESEIVKGLVLDHGGRHLMMPKRITNAGVLLLNVSLEFEKTEINSSIVFKTAQQKEKLAESERELVSSRTRAIIEFFKTCKQFSSFIVVNLKGIEPLALEMFANAGILALRRAKRRNVDRIMHLCGGSLYSSLDDLNVSGLGTAGLIYEKAIGDDKYTFIEETPLSKACTILLRGSSDLSLKLLQDSVKLCLRYQSEFLRSPYVVPGGGSIYLEMIKHLKAETESKIDDSAASANIVITSFMNIFRTLHTNCGLSKTLLHERINVLAHKLICRKF